MFLSQQTLDPVPQGWGEHLLQQAVSCGRRQATLDHIEEAKEVLAEEVLQAKKPRTDPRDIPSMIFEDSEDFSDINKEVARHGLPVA